MERNIFYPNYETKANLLIQINKKIKIFTE
jgi:hypothetical protein